MASICCFCSASAIGFLVMLYTYPNAAPTIRVVTVKTTSIFKNVDSVDKGLFNYQFYNAMAKQAKSESQNYYDREIANSYRDKSNYYYNLKDKSTLKILELSDYKDTEAYFIKVKSKALKNKLFEIILHDKNMILHSTSKVVLNRLKNENVFNDTVKKSLIDEYINHRY